MTKPKLFVVALILRHNKHNALDLTTSYRMVDSENEALGAAVTWAKEAHPGWDVASHLITEIPPEHITAAYAHQNRPTAANAGGQKLNKYGHEPHCNLMFPATLGTEDDVCDCAASTLRAPATSADGLDVTDAALEDAVQAVAARAGDSETILVINAFDAIRALKKNRFALPSAVMNRPAATSAGC